MIVTKLQFEGYLKSGQVSMVFLEKKSDSSPWLIDFNLIDFSDSQHSKYVRDPFANLIFNSSMEALCYLNDFGFFGKVQVFDGAEKDPMWKTIDIGSGNL